MRINWSSLRRRSGNGVPFASLAQRVQANLEAAGFHIELGGATVGTWLQKYRDGKMAFGLSLWGPDYPDPLDYLAFMPGELVGTRAGWPAGSGNEYPQGEISRPVRISFCVSSAIRSFPYSQARELRSSYLGRWPKRAHGI